MLLAGGSSNGTLVAATLKTAVVYSYLSDSWATAANMAEARFAPAAAPLGDGTAILVGGYDETGTTLDTTEIYDPDLDNWSSGPALNTARSYPGGAPVGDGRVLVVGGNAGGGGGTLASAELYDPLTNDWTIVAPMAVAREAPSCVMLSGNRVLVTGVIGVSDNINQIYHADTDTWTSADPSPNTTEFSVTAPLSGDRAFVGLGSNIASATNDALIYTDCASNERCCVGPPRARRSAAPYPASRT